MFTRETYFKFYFLFFVVANLSYAVLGLDIILQNHHNPPFLLNFSELVRCLLLSVFLLGNYLFFRDFIERREIFNVESLFRLVLITGTITLGLYYLVSYIPDIIHNVKRGLGMLTHSDAVPVNPVLNYVVKLLKPFVALFFFFMALMFFKKLIFLKKTKSDIILWNIFQTYLLLGITFVFFPEGSASFKLIYFIVGGVLVFLISVRLRWIGMLNIKEKGRIIALLGLIGLIAFIQYANLFSVVIIRELNEFFGDQFIASLKLLGKGLEINPDSILIDMEENRLIRIDKLEFTLLLSTTVLINVIVSWLAIVFNLPISSFMQERAAELSSFHEMNQVIQSKLNLERLFEKLFRGAIDSTKAGVAWLEIKSGGKTYEYVYPMDYNHKDQLVAIERIVEVQMMDPDFLSYTTTPNEYYVANFDKTPFYKEIKTNLLSFVYFKIKNNEEELGKLILLKDFSSGFDEYMIRVVRTYIDQTKLALINYKLLQETIEAERLKEEFEIAKKVQQKLLPQNIPPNKYFDIACFNEPALDVGGDYYDFVQVSENEFAVTIADVSGKGTSAAFHVAEMKGIFQALIQLNLSVEEFINQANKAVAKCFDKGVFITLTYLKIDVLARRIVYSRAGHCPVLYYRARNDKIAYLKDDGLAMGVIRNEDYLNHLSVREIDYDTGDIIVLFTDGITETRKKNSTHGEYGEDKLMACVRESKAFTSRQIVDAIIKNLSEFSGNNLSFDDITLIVIKF